MRAATRCAGRRRWWKPSARASARQSGIDAMLTGEPHAFWREYKEVATDYDPEADPAPYPREDLNLIALERRKNNFDEVEQAWNEAAARRQARRCLRCDYGKAGLAKGACT
jgi:hypothetical protein